METGLADSSTYYVRVDGRILGPFPMSVIASMRERGRIGADSEISTDRRIWFPHSRLSAGPNGSADAVPLGLPVPAGPGGLINSPPAAGSPAPWPPGSTTADVTQCFYSVDGAVVGPIEFSALMVLARDGRLTSRDRVWLVGRNDWQEAGGVPGLVFKSQRSKLAAWFSANPALATTGLLAFLVLVVGPAALVMGRAYLHESEQQRLAAQAKEQHESKLRSMKESLDQNEKEQQRLIEREKNLLNQRLQMESQREQVQLQILTITTENAARERVQQRMTEIEGQIEAVDTALEQARAELAGKIASFEEGFRQYQEEQNRANWDETLRDWERNDTLKKQLGSLKKIEKNTQPPPKKDFLEKLIEDL